MELYSGPQKTAMDLKKYSERQQEIFRKNPDLVEVLNALYYDLQDLQRPPDQQLIDDVDLQKILKISKRTAASYRSQGVLPYSKLGGKVYYLYSDVLRAVLDNRIPGSGGTGNIRLS